MIQLTRKGLVVTGDDEVRALAETFDSVKCVKLRNFVEPRLLDWMSAAIARGRFVPRVHEDLDPPATDLTIADHDIRSTMLLLFNDRSLFSLVERLSGCDPIGSFMGSTYRMDAGGRHTDQWHDDIYEGRMVALSLNLSPQPYRGGLLQLRECGSQRIIHEVANVGFGDAILFRLALGLEHRVSEVLDGPPKTAYAGWFKSRPSRASFLIPPIEP
jgi:2OG-Fe(II) oxygenase superfamily